MNKCFQNPVLPDISYPRSVISLFKTISLEDENIILRETNPNEAILIKYNIKDKVGEKW